MTSNTMNKSVTDCTAFLTATTLQKRP